MQMTPVVLTLLKTGELTTPRDHLKTVCWDGFQSAGELVDLLAFLQPLHT